MMDLNELTAAYLDIAGNLPEDLNGHVSALKTEWDEYRGKNAPSVPTKSSPKIGRNDPCPCGSGQKYKKCCLGQDSTTP